MSILNMNICLVDDDPLYSDFLAKSLRNKKHHVTCFSSGIQILDELNRKPDLIFIDVQMDIMDGFQTTRILKKKWPSARIVLISSNERAENILKGESRFHDSFEVKSKDIAGMLIQLNHFKKRKQLLLFLKVFAISILAVVLWFFLI